LKESKAIQIDIIPAQPGIRIIYQYDEEYVVENEPVIAWRIETHEWRDKNFTITYPVTTEGGNCDNAVGVAFSDGTVEIDDETHASIEDFMASRLDCRGGTL